MLHLERVRQNGCIYMYALYLVCSGTEIHMNFITYTSFHFSIRITVFEEPVKCTVWQVRWNLVYIEITKWKFEVIGSYEA